MLIYKENNFNDLTRVSGNFSSDVKGFLLNVYFPILLTHFRWWAYFKVQESKGFLPQTEGGCHTLQQSVRYRQLHLRAPGDPAANWHHHSPGEAPDLVIERHWNSRPSLTIDSLIASVSDFQVSTMGITPFFVENVSELQLCAISLVTAVSFGWYFSV